MNAVARCINGSESAAEKMRGDLVPHLNSQYIVTPQIITPTHNSRGGGGTTYSILYLMFNRGALTAPLLNSIVNYITYALKFTMRGSTVVYLI